MSKGEKEKKKKKKGSGIKEYEDIDNADGQVECISEIDKFYKDYERIEGLIGENVIFKRKAYLVTRLKGSGHEKEFCVALVPTVLAAILSLVLTTDMIDLFTWQSVISQVLICVVFGLILFYVVILFNAVFREKEADWDQIKKYELVYIEKALEKHTKTVTLNGKITTRENRG